MMMLQLTINLYLVLMVDWEVLDYLDDVCNTVCIFECQQSAENTLITRTSQCGCNYNEFTVRSGL